MSEYRKPIAEESMQEFPRLNLVLPFAVNPQREGLLFKWLARKHGWEFLTHDLFSRGLNPERSVAITLDAADSDNYGYSTLRLYGSNLEDVKALAELLEPFTHFKKKEDKVMMYSFTASGKIKAKAHDRDNGRFNSVLCPMKDLSWISSYMEGPENILILSGDPGVGKTRLAERIALSACNSVFVVTATSAALSPQLWDAVESHEPDCIIFDDLDIDLGEDGAAQFRQTLLTYGDGIGNSSTKIIITTNRSLDDIHPAIVRPGRLFDAFVLKGLSEEEAKEIWINEFGKTEEEYTVFFEGISSHPTAAELESNKHCAITKRKRNFIPEQYRGVLENIGNEA